MSVRRASGSRPRVGLGPLRVEVLTYSPTVFTHCQHCEVAFGRIGIGERLRREQAASSLPEDLRAEFASLAEWLHRLIDRHGPWIDVRLVDVASIPGVWKSLRYRIRSYPAVIVDGRERFTGRDLPLAEAEIERRVAGEAGRRGAG